MIINDPEILEEVQVVFFRYEAALVSNDVETLDRLFWNSPHVIRYGATENLHGHDEILAFLKARPTRGLDRALKDTVITSFGRDFATASTLFTRPGEPRMGRQMQSWARLPEGWRIVAAHVSWMDG